MNNLGLIICSLCLTIGLAQAQSASETLVNCSKEQDSLKRLVCYDRLATGLNKPVQTVLPKVAKMAKNPPADLKVSKVSTAAEPARVKEAEKIKMAADNFGIKRKTEREDTADKIYAKVSVITKGPYKNLLLTLDNGQRWKQTESGYLRLKVGEQVYVERGALGSFFLSTDDVNRRLRVKRIE